MYTVKELIEALEQCPKDFPVMVKTPNGFEFVVSLGIDLNEKTVDLFTA